MTRDTFIHICFSYESNPLVTKVKGVQREQSPEASVIIPINYHPRGGVRREKSFNVVVDIRLVR